MAAARLLRSPAPSAGGSLSPEREALRIAIEGKQAAEVRFQRHEEAIERARSMVANADRQLAKATAAVVAARSHLVSQSFVSSDGVDPASSNIRDALSREADARDALLVARQNLETLQAAYQDAPNEMHQAADRVRKAAVAVTYLAADELIERAASALGAWRKARAGLYAITSFDIEFPPSSQFRRARLASEVDEADLILSDELQASWVDALDALQRDATAPLPVQSDE